MAAAGQPVSILNRSRPRVLPSPLAGAMGSLIFINLVWKLE